MMALHRDQASPGYDMHPASPGAFNVNRSPFLDRSPDRGRSPGANDLAREPSLARLNGAHASPDRGNGPSLVRHNGEPGPIGYLDGHRDFDPRLAHIRDRRVSARAAWAGPHDAGGPRLSLPRAVSALWGVTRTGGAPPLAPDGGPRASGAARRDLHTRLPNRLRVTVVTWNWCGAGPPESLAQQLVASVTQGAEGPFMPPPGTAPGGWWGGGHTREETHHPDRDVYIVASQEAPLAGAGAAAWEAAIGAALGPRYARVASSRLDPGGWIHLGVWARAELMSHITEVCTAGIATGAGGLLGTKGGVGVALSVGPLRLLVIGAHLPAHAGNADARNAAVARIAAEMLSPSGPMSRTITGVLVADSRTTAAQAERDAAAAAEHRAAGCCGLSASAAPPRRRPPPRPGAASPPTGHHLAAKYAGTDPTSPWMLATVSEGGGDGDLIPPWAAMHEGADAVTSTTPAGGQPFPVVAEGGGHPATRVTHEADRRAAADTWVAGRDLGDYDAVIWTGDLNYRLDTSGAAVAAHLASGDWHALWSADELTQQRRRGRVFPGFDEGVLNFPPTYKLLPGSDAYDGGGKHRVPSWTDRVLYASPDDLVSLIRYVGLAEPRCSDHKAVAAALEIAMPRKRVRGGAGVPEWGDGACRCC